VSSVTEICTECAMHGAEAVLDVARNEGVDEAMTSR